MACLGPGNFWNDATLASAVSTLEPFAKKDSRYMTACRREGRFATTSAPKPCIMVDSLDLGLRRWQLRTSLLPYAPGGTDASGDVYRRQLLPSGQIAVNL